MRTDTLLPDAAGRASGDKSPHSKTLSRLRSFMVVASAFGVRRFIAALAAVAALVHAPAAEPRGLLTPRLSPDGAWVAVSYQGAIAKIHRAGGPLVILTRGEGWDSDPAWSPDGARIAYVATPVGGGAGTLKLIESASGAPLATPQAVPAAGPLWWHPDGRRLLGRFGAGAAPRLGWFEVATGGVSPLAIGGLESRMARALSAPYALADDGRAVFFAVHQDVPGEQGGNDGAHAELFRAPAEGGAVQLVVRFPARIYALSADGRGRGVYAVTDAGVAHNDIWHVPFDAPERGARKLTLGQADEDAPSSDRLGQWLVHTDNSAGSTRLSRRHTETGITDTIVAERAEFGEPAGRARLTLHDPEEAAPAARLSIRRKGGKFHAPADALYRITAGLAHFYARGAAELELPAGEYQLHAFRGPEYRVTASEFTVRAGATVGVRVPLERWTNPAARGWYSGENHIHANYGYGAWYVTPQTLIDQLDGEDLRVSNLVVANSDGEAVFDREFFSGGPHALSTPGRIIYWNQEFRSTLWGHLTLFNLTRLVEPIFTGFRGTTNPFDVPTTAEIAARTRAQNGVTSYTHPTSNAHDIFLHAYSAKGLPVDVALGRIDTIDVMGGVYGTSLPIWYHVLNCGFRIPAAAGTDCFLNRVRSAPPGYGRVYVHLPGGLNYAGWVAGLKAGRSFVSNGPVLEFTANGQPVGDTVALSAPTRIRVRGRVDSQFPLRSFELIYNGRVVVAATTAPDKLSATIDHEVEIERSGWLAVRAFGPAAPYWQGGDRSAHSNPIYVDVRGQPAERRASAQYFLAWIDRLEQLLVARDRMDSERVHVLAHLEQAREVYRGMLP